MPPRLNSLDQMPAKLFSLNGVPDDEAEEVRALLTSGEIDFYETSAGNWGISAPAIWIRDKSQHAQAQTLLDEYQHDRMLRVRAEYAQRKSEGENRTIIDVFLENPLRFLVYLVVIVVVLYFSIKPFLDIGK